jgi:hypothetical protein
MFEMPMKPSILAALTGVKETLFLTSTYSFALQSLQELKQSTLVMDI